MPRTDPGPAFLGVDVGTRSTKAVAIGADGVLLATAAVDHEVTSPRPGWFEHDPTQVWWLGLVSAVRSVLAALPSGVAVEAVGLTSCGPCLVPVDADGEPLRPGILYGVDTRAADQVARLASELGAAQVLNAYGMPLTSQSVGPKIDWLVESEPEVYRRTAQLLTANGFAALRLTGRACVDHHQAAYFAPYYRDGSWDRAHDRAGVIDRLPELVWSDEVVGVVTAAAAALTGLPEGLPVVLGSSDGLTSAYGAGAITDGSAVLNYGSTLGLTVTTSSVAATGGVWRTPGASAGRTSLVAGLATGGVLATRFVDEFARELAADRPAAHRVLAQEAEASPPGADGLLLLPYFAGERTPFYDPGAAGVLLGLRLGHTRGDHYRAILEGTAFGVRHVLAELDRMGVTVDRVRAVGGGTGSPLWQQVVSDVTGLRQEVVVAHHGAATGAAVLAAVGVGEDDERPAILAELAQVSVTRTVTPSGGLKPLYDSRFQLYLDAYERTRPIIAGLAATR